MSRALVLSRVYTLGFEVGPDLVALCMIKRLLQQQRSTLEQYESKEDPPLSLSGAYLDLDGGVLCSISALGVLEVDKGGQTNVGMLLRK